MSCFLLKTLIKACEKFSVATDASWARKNSAHLSHWEPILSLPRSLIVPRSRYRYLRKPMRDGFECQTPLHTTSAFSSVADSGPDPPRHVPVQNLSRGDIENLIGVAALSTQQLAAKWVLIDRFGYRVCPLGGVLGNIDESTATSETWIIGVWMVFESFETSVISMDQSLAWVHHASVTWTLSTYEFPVVLAQNVRWWYGMGCVQSAYWRYSEWRQSDELLCRPRVRILGYIGNAPSLTCSIRLPTLYLLIKLTQHSSWVTWIKTRLYIWVLGIVWRYVFEDTHHESTSRREASHE